MSWFKDIKPEFKPYVIEVEKATAPEETVETVSAVHSLQSHEGFKWLLKKLKYQAARLQYELTNRHHETLEDVYFLQSGVQWCNWLQQQIDIAHDKFQNMRPATSSETMFFNDIDAFIERVGITEPQAQ